MSAHSTLSPVDSLPGSTPPLVIVDDSIDDRDYLRHLIERAGVQEPVVGFETGEMVTEFLAPWVESDRTDLPVLMFLDLKLPGMNGHEVVRWIRRHPALGAMEIALLSGSLLYADMRIAAGLGVNHYFEKFPSTNAIRRCVDAAVRSRLVLRERRMRGAVPR